MILIFFFIYFSVIRLIHSNMDTTSYIG